MTDALSTWHCFLNKDGFGRDKFGRFVQYATRLVRGLLNVHLAQHGKDDAHAARIRDLLAKNQSLMFWMMHSRRTYRWCKSTGPLLQLRRVLLRGKPCPWGGRQVDRGLFVASRALLVLWHLHDLQKLVHRTGLLALYLRIINDLIDVLELRHLHMPLDGMLHWHMLLHQLQHLHDPLVNNLPFLLHLLMDGHWLHDLSIANGDETEPQSGGRSPSL